jgi:hypothetical protein
MGIKLSYDYSTEDFEGYIIYLVTLDKEGDRGNIEICVRFALQERGKRLQSGQIGNSLVFY